MERRNNTIKNKSKDEINLKDNNIIIKERKNKSAEKRNKKDGLYQNKHLNRTIDLKKPEINEKYRAKLESDKEKKEYELKIRIMKNHISAMKRQKEDMNKKINFLKHKEENINNVKKEKENNKKIIMEYNINRKYELDKKRKNIEKQRENMKKEIKESSEKTKMEKINKYRQSQKEKKEANNKLNDINQKNIKNQIEKIKMIRENNKNSLTKRKKKLNDSINYENEKKYEKNIEKTKLLKLQIQKLQNEEDECLADLNKTKERLNTFSSTEKIYFYKVKSRKNSEKMSVRSFENENNE